MKKKKIILMFLVLATMFAIPNVVKAGFQSKPGGKVLKKAADEFFEGCRKMETKGGVLGLNENINATTYTGSTGNGIDVHMALNTEWGTIALLTDSAYGIGREIEGNNNSKTSTDNATGVYNLADETYELVATTYSGTTCEYNKKIRSADSRYFNIYSSETPKSGDALECVGWLSTIRGYYVNIDFPVNLRNGNSLFGYGNGNGYTMFSIGKGSSGSGFSGYGSTRAVVVCGTGL